MQNKKTMRKLIIFCFLLVVSPWTSSGAAGIPSPIDHAIQTTLTVHFGKENRCSAVRVNENLILSAAHCLLGYDGKASRTNSIYSDIQGVRYWLRIAEIGAFAPPKGKMEDWVLLTPKEGTSLPSSVAVVFFPTNQEFKNILKNLGDFEGRKGIPVWTVTYPFFAARSFPRQGSDGKGPFVSKGFLKSEMAYKKYILWSSTRFQLCDEQFNFPCPKMEVDVEGEWKKLAQNFVAEDVYHKYWKYKNNGDPLLYHTADYANGSSGGGIFIEKSGHYLGLIPMGSSIGDRRTTFIGIGQLYRIDVICRQSKILGQLEKCKGLKI